MAKHESVEAYMATLPADRRAGMEQLRQAIRAVVPEATEVISYNMPAFRLGRRFFVSYEAFTHHYSLFPRTEAMEAELGDELAPHTTGKGTLRFAADEPIPVDLVRRIVEIRLREFSAG